MSYDGGVITREDIFSKEALDVGTEYAKNLEKAINANKQFIDSIKEINQLATSIRQVKSTSEYVKIKEKEKKVIEESNTVWKEQDALEKRLISTLKQKELATEATNKALIKHRLELQETNKQIKQEILERTGQIGQYKKLENALNNVRNQAKNVKAEMFFLEQQGKKNDQAYRNLEIRSKALTLQTNILDKGIKDIDKSLGQHQREVGNYAIAANALNPIFGRVNSQLSMMGISLDDLANKPNPFKALTSGIMAFGKATVAFLLTPVGAALAILGSLFALIYSNKQTVIDFNSGLLDVSKTTGISGAELTKLGDDVVKLSRNLKTVGTPALMEYATVAGQLGVKGSENILRFTRALAMLETASTIKGEEGASQIARLLTLVDGGVENIQDFGDEIVKLGNNFAATESEILSNATAIAQNTGVYKIGRQDVLAYATATKSVGIEAELTGSTIGRTLGQMEKAIRTGKNVETIARLTGQSVEDLKTSFREDSSKVFYSFVEGLNAVDNAGGSVNAQLENIGITSVRDQRVIGSLATGGFETLANSMDTVKNASGAMTEEFETAQGKLENQLKRVGIAWDNLVLSIENGEGILSRIAAFFSGQLAEVIEYVTVGINELSLAWKIIGSYLDDIFPKTEKTEKGFFSLLKTIFSFKTATNVLRAFMRILLKHFVVDIPNAVTIAKASFDIFINSIKGIYDLVKAIAPEVKKYLIDMINPFAESDSTAILTAANKSIQKTLNENIQIRAVAANKVLDNQKKFAERMKKAQEDVAKGEEEALKKRNERDVDVQDTDNDSKRKDYLSKLKESYEKEIDLKIWRIKRSSEINKELATDEKRSVVERLGNFEKYHSDLYELERLEAEKKLTVLSNFNEKSKALTNEEIQNYLDANTSIDNLTNEQKLVLEKWYAAKEDFQKKYIKASEEQAKKEAQLIAKQTANVLLGVDKDNFDELKKLEEQYQRKEITTEQYEKKLAEISLKYTTKTFEEQIKGLKELVDLTGYSEEEKLKIKTQIAEAEMKLIKAKNDYEKDQSEKSIEVYKKKLDIVRKSVNDFSFLFAETFDIDSRIVEDFIMNLLDATTKIEEKIKSVVAFIREMTNAAYQQRINEIDNEIAKTDEKYEREIQLAEGNEQLQERLRIKQQADVEKLEAKKRKEQQKQANANKAFAIAQTVWATAQAIMQAYAQLGPIGGTIAAVLVGTLGAIQINQIRNQEIPKYEFGTRGKPHKGGLAELAEKRPEVVKEPGEDPYIVNKRGFYNLPKGTEVIPSVDEYNRMQRTAMIMSLANEKQNLDTYQMNMMFDSVYGAQAVNELKKMREDLKYLGKQKNNVNISNNIDFGHQFWRNQNLNWRK